MKYTTCCSALCLTALTSLSAADYLLQKEIRTLPSGEILTNVTGLAVTPDGAVYAAAGPADPILIFTPNGNFLRAFGKEDIGNKHGIRYLGNALYVTDIKDHRVLKYSPDGKLLKSWGIRGEPGLDAAHFNAPTDVALAENGDMFVTDGYGNSRVAVFDCNGNFKFDFGQQGNGPGQFNMPHNIVIRQNTVYIADRGNKRLQIFDLNGKLQKVVELKGNPFSLAFDRDGMLLVSVTEGNNFHGILKFDDNFKEIARFDNSNDGTVKFKIPHGIVRHPLTGDLIIGGAGDQTVYFLTEKQ